MLTKLRRPARVFALAPLLLILACNDREPSETAPQAADTTKAAATAQAPARDWTQVIERTAEGGFRMGNPDAPVKLIEFASLTCPHCKDFHEAAAEPLKNEYVKSGQVSYELRNFVLNGPDYAATLLTRCQGPETFFRLTDAFFRNQESWTQPFTKITEADQRRLEALPQNQQIAGLADTGQLHDFMRPRGMTKAQFNQCLTNEAEIEALARIREAAISQYQLTGTPSFVINGEVQKEVYDWASLKPRLQQALR